MYNTYYVVQYLGNKLQLDYISLKRHDNQEYCAFYLIELKNI